MLMSYLRLRQFFLRGTQLEQLTVEYEKIKLNIEAATEVVQRKSEAVPELKRAYRAAKARSSEVEQSLVQGAKLEVLRNELAWAYVEEMEEVSLL